MSADYSFYATLCGYMPRPEGVLKGKDESLSLFVLEQLHAVRVMNRVMIGQHTSSLLSSLYSYSAVAEQHLPQNNPPR